MEELEKAIKDTKCMKCMDKLRKQQVIDEKMYDQKFIDDTVKTLAWDELQKNIVMDGDMMMDIRTGEIFVPEVDNTH